MRLLENKVWSRHRKLSQYIKSKTLYPVLQIVYESNLKCDLQDGGDAVDDVQGVKVFALIVVVARDDGEEVVEEAEDGGEAKQRHVQVHLDGDVLLVGVPEIQLLSLGDPDN